MWQQVCGFIGIQKLLNIKIKGLFMRVLFFSTMPNAPTGGVRVIYRFVSLLNKMGVESYVYHELSSYKYKWSDGNSPIYKRKKINSSDHVVIPDVFIGRESKEILSNNCSYSLFIQNPYILKTVKRYSNENYIENVFKNSFKILCISEDTIRMITKMFPECSNKIIRVTWSMDIGSFHVANRKKRIISYMPRKNSDHVDLVLDMLSSALPSTWKLKKIQGMSIEKLQKTLSESSIFLSFGSFEGLPAPPIEAAICGNYVIGYHGNGGLEYWNKPNFLTVNVCEIEDYVDKILHIISKINNNPECFFELDENIKELKELISENNEMNNLNSFAKSLNDLNLKDGSKVTLPFKTNMLAYQINKVITKSMQIFY
jgi:glycosyltransferase involved in cell wall biosynthesis